MNSDFKEFIKLLNQEKVKYLILGGYAIAFYGYPRYTKDLDVWVDRNAENTEKLIKVLDLFGFGSLEINSDDFMVPGRVIQLGYPPVRIDIINAPDGVDFQECFEKKVVASIDNVSANFIDLENLKKNKRACGRAQDIADLENLK